MNEVTKSEPATFSPASARLAIEGLFEALPKTRRLEYIGNLNEAMVVLDKLTQLAKISDKNAAV